MSDSDLLNGQDLNNIKFDNYGHQVPPNTVLDGGWRAGPYNQGVWLINRKSNSLRPCEDGGGITTAVRLSAVAKKGSVYHSLGILQKDTTYAISWSATADHDDNSSLRSNYTVRVAVNSSGTLNSAYGGIENSYTAGASWSVMRLEFQPTETQTFYLSFMGGDDKHPGALISKVSAGRKVSVPDNITIMLDSPLKLTLSEDSETPDHLTSSENWVFNFTTGQGKPATDLKEATFTVSGGLSFAGNDPHSFQTRVSGGQTTLTAGRVIATKGFISGTLTVAAAATSTTFPVTVKEETKITADPDNLSLPQGGTKTVELTFTRNGAKVKSATLSVKAKPASIAEQLPATVVITDGKGKLDINAGNIPESGTITVFTGTTTVAITLRVTTSGHSIVWFGQAQSNHLEINTQKMLHMQVLDKNLKPLEGVNVVMTVISDHANIKLEDEISGPAPMLFTTASEGQQKVAVTKRHVDGVYATFILLPGSEGESVLKFTAPDASPLTLTFNAVKHISQSQLIVSPPELHLRPDQTYNDSNLINITVGPQANAPALNDIRYNITGPTEDGLYVKDNHDNKLKNGTLNVEHNVAKITTIETNKNTTTPQTPYVITFWTEDRSITPKTTKVFIENGDQVTFNPAVNTSSPIPVDLDTNQMLTNCSIQITDLEGKAVANARYYFNIVNSESKAEFLDTQRNISNTYSSKISGLIMLPTIKVGEQPGDFKIQAVSDTNNGKAYDGWHFIAKQPLPILVIKFYKIKDIKPLMSGMNYKEIDIVQAFTDVNYTNAAHSGKINFTIIDTDGTKTYFGDGNKETTTLIVDIINGEAAVPELTAGIKGSFKIYASVVGTTHMTIVKTLTIQ